MKSLNKIPFIVGLFIFVSCKNLTPVRMIDYPQYRIKEVIDGDTLWVIDDQGEELKIRFACADAPEIAQEYSMLLSP